MTGTVLQRIPVVAGLAYIERVRRLQSTLTVTLVVEPANRYFRHAISVMANGEKVGYVAPEVSVGYFELLNAGAAPMTCLARRGSASDHQTSGVELLLDFTTLPVPPPG